ncbi:MULTISPECIES: DUF6119 family protein [Alphaproteobacteria]|uniref:Sporadically distributed protein, TIGR04141 family n=2 Tax=Alphaproteobacteria TaxID=28211 RepID=A0A512HFX3_9HYPH|nr:MULTISPECIES: DUF6119 family protein [Alphaproteobacteria]GEO84347.1 hypothetical protein RNA01_12790 [Ciceribacter naphthalenivorans]GLR24884.1 hypothetical protein GCM10007920_46780 [Ciceribacter naphthalenivorans]GLT07740.1 hypothetical protein GCM10007926_46780 [Sphingomonas psychrolutea]
MADKARNFTVFLLRDGVDATNCLTDEHKLSGTFTAKNLPEGATLFVLDTKESEPWWKSYFQVGGKLPQVSKGAVIVVPVKNRHFALCFGHVQHNLRNDAYVYDFGLRVTLNSIDREKLKSTDTLEPGASRRRRTQLPNESDLTLFDFDQDSSILRSLTGKVKPELEDLFKHPTGTSNLRLSTKRASSKLPELCEKLLELYASKDYETIFPDIRNIEPVRDPTTIASLNDNLVASIRAKSNDVTLTIPEIVDYSRISQFTLSGAGAGKVYQDIFIGRYYEYLENSKVDLNDINVASLERYRLVALDDDENQVKPFSIYRCLVFDTKLNGDPAIYHLDEGVWYKFDATLVERLNTYLDPLLRATPDLPDYNHGREDAYNIAVERSGLGYGNLDKKNIAPPGQKQIEPSDLISLEDGQAVFVHVKISTSSKELSHLFNQAVNSVETLRDDPASVERLRMLLKGLFTDEKTDSLIKAVEAGNILVRYAVITHKDAKHLSENFPLFSRLSLARAMKTLKRMGVARRCEFVADVSDPDGGKKKTRKKKGKAAVPVEEAVIEDDGPAEEA